MNLIPAIKKDEALIAEMDSLLHDEKQFSPVVAGTERFLIAVERTKSFDRSLFIGFINKKI